MSTTDPQLPTTAPTPSSRWLVLRAVVTGVVSGATRALITWLLQHH